jgi:hypothetical protein
VISHLKVTIDGVLRCLSHSVSSYSHSFSLLEGTTWSTDEQSWPVCDPKITIRPQQGYPLLTWKENEYKENKCPNTRESEVGGSQVRSQSGLYSETLCRKEKEGNEEKSGG